MGTVNWRITATTIYCDAVDDEVTLLVYGDGSAKCTGLKKYFEPAGETAKELDRKGRGMKRKLACVGPTCSRISEYKDKLMAEEGGEGK